MGRPYKCPYCNSVETARKGHRKTKQMGLRSIRKCKACGRKFTPKHQSPRQPTEPEHPEGLGQPTEPQPAMPEPHPEAPPTEAARPDGAPA